MLDSSRSLIPHSLCAGELWGHHRAPPAEAEAEVQELRLVPEEHLPRPARSRGPAGLARSCECLPPSVHK